MRLTFPLTLTAILILRQIFNNIDAVGKQDPDDWNLKLGLAATQSAIALCTEYLHMSLSIKMSATIILAVKMKNLSAHLYVTLNQVVGNNANTKKHARKKD